MAASFFSSLASRFTTPWTSNFSSASSASRQSTSPSLNLCGETERREEAASDQTLLCVFRILDQNGDGFVSVREICEGLHRLGVDIPHQQMSDLLSLASVSGLLTYSQFEALYASLCADSEVEIQKDDYNDDCENVTLRGNHGHVELLRIDSPNPRPEQSGVVTENHNPNLEQKNEDLLLLEAFGVYDKNADGFVSLPELQSVLCGMGFSQCRDFTFCRRIMERVDTNGDGRLDFSEFKDMMLQHEGSICHV